MTGATEWTYSFPNWQATVPPGYEQYEHLFLYTMVFLGMGLLPWETGGWGPAPGPPWKLTERRASPLFPHGERLEERA